MRGRSHTRALRNPAPLGTRHAACQWMMTGPDVIAGTWV